MHAVHFMVPLIQDVKAQPASATDNMCKQ
nr:unnamed protein product [Callosobruchus chinensis]